MALSVYIITDKAIAILYEWLIYYIKLKSRPSALSCTLIFQPLLHGLKRDLFEMKAVSLRITKFIFTSLSQQRLVMNIL